MTLPAGSHEQHMHKALERMNLKIHDVISDLAGMSGLKMIEAILAGQRDPVALLALCDPQIQKHKAGRLRAALEGTWKAEHLFALRQAYELWQSGRLKAGQHAATGSWKRTRLLVDFVDGLAENELKVLTQRQPWLDLFVLRQKIEVLVRIELHSHLSSFRLFLDLGVDPLISVLEEVASAHKAGLLCVGLHARHRIRLSRHGLGSRPRTGAQLGGHWRLRRCRLPSA
jgi:hypothetical protein